MNIFTFFIKHTILTIITIIIIVFLIFIGWHLVALAIGIGMYLYSKKSLKFREQYEKTIKKVEELGDEETHIPSSYQDITEYIKKSDTKILLINISNEDYLGGIRGNYKNAFEQDLMSLEDNDDIKDKFDFVQLVGSDDISDINIHDKILRYTRSILNDTGVAEIGQLLINLVTMYDEEIRQYGKGINIDTIYEPLLNPIIEYYGFKKSQNTSGSIKTGNLKYYISKVDKEIPDEPISLSKIIEKIPFLKTIINNIPGIKEYLEGI